MITERTKSIYPSCFAHGILNNLITGILASMFMVESKVNEELSYMKAGIELYPALVVSITVMFVVSLYLFCKKTTQNK